MWRMCKGNKMNKLYFWLDEHKWRIILWLFIGFCTIVTLGKTDSYISAVVQLCALYSVSWMGCMSFIEGAFFTNKKEAKEIADRIIK